MYNIGNEELFFSKRIHFHSIKRIIITGIIVAIAICLSALLNGVIGIAAWVGLLGGICVYDVFYGLSEQNSEWIYKNPVFIMSFTIALIIAACIMMGVTEIGGLNVQSSSGTNDDWLISIFMLFLLVCFIVLILELTPFDFVMRFVTGLIGVFVADILVGLTGNLLMFLGDKNLVLIIGFISGLFLSGPLESLIDRFVNVEYKIATEKFESGSYEEAINLYRSCLKKYPNYVRAIIGYGASLANVERNDEAIQQFDLAIKKDPRAFEAWAFKGRVLMKNDRFEEALACIDKAISIERVYLPAWNYKKEIYDATNPDEASECNLDIHSLKYRLGKKNLIRFNW